MILLVQLNFIFLCGLAFIFVKAAGSSVTLDIKTTGCEHNCVIYDKGKCPSSIKVNGKEYSHKEDGFNVVIIDNFSGEIKTDYFRWFSGISAYRWKMFRDYFTTINSSSTVVVALQNMCGYFDRRWYRYLSGDADIQISHPARYKYNSAILVGCKMACPKFTKGYIPFNYYGVSEAYTKVISFTLGKDEATDENGGKQGLPKGKKKKKKKTGGNVGSVLGGIIAVIFIICIVVFLYIRYKRSVDDTDWKDLLVCLKKDESAHAPGGGAVFYPKHDIENRSPPEAKVSGDQPEYAALFPDEKAPKTAPSKEHIYAYIDKDELNITTAGNSAKEPPRETENEYYSPSNFDEHLYQPPNSGISAACPALGDGKPPEVFKPRPLKNRPASMRGPTSYPARPDKPRFNTMDNFDKGKYRSLPQRL